MASNRPVNFLNKVMNDQKLPALSSYNQQLHLHKFLMKINPLIKWGPLQCEKKKNC